MDPEGPLAALGDPARRRIVQLLAAGPLPVKAIQEHFTFSQPALSKHLRILRDAGLVVFERIGRTHRYALRGEQLRDAAAWMLELYEFWQSHLNTLGQVLDDMDDADDVNAPTAGAIAKKNKTATKRRRSRKPGSKCGKSGGRRPRR